MMIHEAEYGAEHLLYPLLYSDVVIDNDHSMKKYKKG